MTARIPAPSLRSPITCANCQVVFFPRTSAGRYCSRVCQNYHHNRRRLTRSVFGDITCAWHECGKVFRQTSRTRRFCSRTCGNAYHHANRGERSYVPVVKPPRSAGPHAIECFECCDLPWRRVVGDRFGATSGNCWACAQPYEAEPSPPIELFLHTEGNLARAQRIAPGNVGTWHWQVFGEVHPNARKGAA